MKLEANGSTVEKKAELIEGNCSPDAVEEQRLRVVRLILQRQLSRRVRASRCVRDRVPHGALVAPAVQALRNHTQPHATAQQSFSNRSAMSQQEITRWWGRACVRTQFLPAISVTKLKKASFQPAERVVG